MSNHIAHAALSRMNLREVAVSPVYTGLAADLHQLSTANPEQAQKALMDRRAELCAAFGVQGEQRKPFAFAAGLAIIPVSGTLINRFGGSYGYVTGYNFIRSQALAAEADPDVVGIVFDLNSYGGEAAGCFECSADLKSLITKPTLGVIDSNCYSACYAVGSAMDRLVATPSAGVGSIGVVMMHVDMSKALADFGYKVTYIFSGDHKVDGNPYEALPDDVRANLQANVDARRQEFAQLVADNRGLDLKAVLDTEARSYRAEEALSLGLIDAIESPSVAVQAFLDELSGSTPSKRKDQPMSEKSTPGSDDQALATANAAAEARTAERARISGIQSCEEAKGRETLANHLALNTDMSVDAAKAILAASPTAAATPAAATPAAAAPNGFKAAMDASQHPNVGADAADGGAGAGEGATLAQQILRDQALATGVKLG
jgi:signal peptide peptidase SppA